MLHRTIAPRGVLHIGYSVTCCALGAGRKRPSVTFYGKGGKTRVVLLPAGLWRLLAQLRCEAGPDAPVFRSAKGGALDPSQVHLL